METSTSTRARATRRWRDGGSRRIEASQKTSSSPTSERSNYGNASATNPATKRSRSCSKLRYDATNNRLPKSVERLTNYVISITEEESIEITPVKHRSGDSMVSNSPVGIDEVEYCIITTAESTDSYIPHCPEVSSVVGSPARDRRSRSRRWGLQVAFRVTG
jgi:hypothetical protein